jgi:tetratricopeptide (TPR) repeat protein
MSNPINTWQEKKQYLEHQLAIVSDASQKFSLREQIKECEQEIARLESQPHSKNTFKHNLPERNLFFTGREDVLNQLEDLLKSNNQIAINQAHNQTNPKNQHQSTSAKHAISGLGGIGKTHTVLEFCHRHINNYQTILWVHSENETDFNNSYSEIVHSLGLGVVGISEPLKPEQIIGLVKNWLATNSNWLMVLDNLEDPNLIKSYLPNNHQGHILITTRSQSLTGYAEVVNLKKMSIDTGTLFLLRRAYRFSVTNENLYKFSHNNKLIAQKIVEEMDGLPLALEQAAAYIHETQCSLDDYLVAYKDVRNTSRVLDNDGETPNDHISVFATFKLAFDKVNEKSNAAAQLLEVCSFLSPDLIPEEIFTNAGHFLGDELIKLKDNSFEFNNAIKVLLKYSLIERNTENKSFSIHRLVQSVVRDLIDDKNKTFWIDNLLKLFASFCSKPGEEPKNWPQYQKLLPSASSLLHFVKLYDLITEEGINLFNQLGIYCDLQALFAQSLDFYQQTLITRKHFFGDNHPAVAATLNNIAQVYYQQSKYLEALDFYQQALSISKSIPGNNHLEVAGTLNNIAIVYGAQGQLSQAFDYHQQALTIRKSYLGSNHPAVAATLNNIGEIYRKQSKYSEALSSYQDALSIYQNYFGDDNLDVAKTLDNIALICTSQKKLDEALALHQQVLSIRKFHFGDNHPEIAQILYNIGNTYYSQDHWPDAFDFYQQAVTIYKSYFGNNHNEVANCLISIANICQKQDQFCQALEHYHQALSIKKLIFSDTHPDIALILHNIGNSYQKQNQSSQALEHYHQALIIKKLILGDIHPNVTDTLHSIALTHQKQGQYDQALNYYQQAFSINSIFFGNNHPNIADTLNNIAATYQEKGQHDQALAFFSQALAIYKHHFGNNYPSVANILNNMAEAHAAQGQFDKALIFYNQSLSIYKKLFGDNHFSVANALEKLGHSSKAIGKETEPINYYQQALNIYDKVLPPNHPWIIQLLNVYSNLLLKLNRNDEAQPLLARLALLNLSD